MTISAAELVRRYGHAVVSHNAALFVGAGLSSAAGYPGWVRLLDPLRQLADVPASMTDLPLVAQYITARLPGGREVLTADILGQLAQVRSSPSAGHEVLRRLAIEEIWTTNYDPLIEEAIPDARVIVAEEDLLDWRQDSRRRILKMHGSTSRDRNSWVAPPVITRTDYETYQSVRQRTWAALQATFLTKSMLFLGFSFLDPNIEVLLRLSRSLNAASYGQHFTVLRQPTEADETSLFDHQVADLEASGITVCLIEEYDELNSILIALERRSREPALFVSGSYSLGEEEAPRSMARQIGTQLAETSASIVSLAGPPATDLSFAFGNRLADRMKYDPARLRFYFRPKSGSPAPTHPERLGTAVYASSEREQLLLETMRLSRAMLVIGGGERTRGEVEAARTEGLPIIPLAATGGWAYEYWSSNTDGWQALAADADVEVQMEWMHLNETSERAASAAMFLLRKALFLDA